MARKKVWPPRVTLHKPSGQSRVRIDGRDHYLGIHDSAEAKAAYARLLVRVAEGRPAADPGQAGPALTVADVVALWLELEAPRYSERGRERDQFNLAFGPLLALHGPTRADTFGVDDLEDIRKAMSTGTWMTEARRTKVLKSGKNPAWCANYCNKMVGRIRSVWRWAERKKHVPEGSWAHLSSLGAISQTDASVRRTGDVKACTRAELDLVCKQCVAPVAAMLQIQWWTGMRSGEVRIMRFCDVDTSNDLWTYKPSVHKCDWRGQSRVVVIGPDPRAILEPFMAGRSGEEYLFRPALKIKHDYYTASVYTHSVRRAALAAGVPGFHPYQCRHAAKKRIAAEHGLEAARAALGQKSIETTASYSAETDLELAKKAAQKAG